MPIQLGHDPARRGRSRTARMNGAIRPTGTEQFPSTQRRSPCSIVAPLPSRSPGEPPPRLAAEMSSCRTPIGTLGGVRRRPHSPCTTPSRQACRTTHWPCHTCNTTVQGTHMTYAMPDVAIRLLSCESAGATTPMARQAKANAEARATISTIVLLMSSR